MHIDQLAAITEVVPGSGGHKLVVACYYLPLVVSTCQLQGSSWSMSFSVVIRQNDNDMTNREGCTQTMLAMVKDGM